MAAFPLRICGLLSSSQSFARDGRLFDPSRKDISEMLRQVLSGLTSVVNGLASMRNKMSDAHASSYKASKHHAKLAVNSAKTFADFIFDTYSYQNGTGKLK